MTYACLVYLTESEITALSQGAWDALNNECMAFGETPVGEVERLGSEALEPTHTATTVRVRNGKIITTDGPFAETKEQLAGFWVIEVDDLDAALAWAEKCAEACWGPIEVRPFDELSQA